MSNLLSRDDRLFVMFVQPRSYRGTFSLLPIRFYNSVNININNNNMNVEKVLMLDEFATLIIFFVFFFSTKYSWTG